MLQLNSSLFQFFKMISDGLLHPSLTQPNYEKFYRSLYITLHN
nr:hypothetical protein [Mucilaginibacter sp. SP1R1]